MEVTSYRKCELFYYLVIASALYELLTQNSNFIRTSFGIAKELPNTSFKRYLVPESVNTFYRLSTSTRILYDHKNVFFPLGMHV